MGVVFVIISCLLLVLRAGGCFDLGVGSGVSDWLGIAWQEISWMGSVVSDFDNRMVPRDLTLVRSQSRLVMILSIIALTK